MIEGNTVLTIDVGGTCLKMAEFSVGGAGEAITLESFAIKEYPQELVESSFVMAFAETFKVMMQENNFISRQVRIAITSLHAFQRLSKLPPLLGSRARAAAVVEGEAKLTVPYPLDEVLWDYQLIKHTQEYEVDAEPSADMDAPAEKITETVEELEALFVAVKEDLASEISSVLLDADMEVLSVEVAPTALYNAARANMFGEEYCDMILDFGGRGSNLIIMDGNRVFVRAIPIGGNTITQQIGKEFSIGMEDAEEMKRKHGFVALGGAYEDSDSEVAATISKIARNVMTRLHGEINRSINAWRSMYGGNRPQRLFISGGSSIIPYVPHFLNEKLHLDVNFLNAFPVINIGGMVDRQELQDCAHVFPPLIGMAIRHIHTCPIEISLVPKVIQAARDFERRKPYFYMSAACLLLLVLVFYGGVSIKTGLSKRLIDYQKQEELKELKAQERLINTSKNELDSQKNILKDLIGIGAVQNEWVKILNELQKCTPEDMWFTSVNGISEYKDKVQESRPAEEENPEDGMGNPENPEGEYTDASEPAAAPSKIGWLCLKGHSLVRDENARESNEDKFFNNLVKASEGENAAFDVQKNNNEINGYRNPSLTMSSGNNNVTSFVIYVKLKKEIEQ